MRKALFFVLIFLYMQCGLVVSQHITASDGNWDDNNTWVEEAPPYSFNNSSSVLINYPNNVLSESSISFNNNGTIDIEGNLEILGNVTARNNLSLNVSKNAVLKVDGNIDVFNNAIVVLDGDIYVDNLYGFNENTNFLFGDGNLYIDGEVDGFNTENFNGNIINDPLPVDLLSFDAMPDNNDVIINWATATEINNDYYTIEKSLDLNIWEIAGYVTGAGNSNDLLNYKYRDIGVNEGIWYYRLKQTDYDGSYKYYQPVSVELSNNKKSTEFIKVGNNNNNINIIVKNSKYPSMLIITDIRGIIIDTIEVNASYENQEIKYTLNNSMPGSFLIFSLINNQSRQSIKYILR